MERRAFLRLIAGGAAGGLLVEIGCAGELPDDGAEPEPGDGADAGATGPPTADAGGATSDAPAAAAPDAAPCDQVLVYDTYAQALYMDGTLGPLTGVIEAEYLLANVPIQLDFWHGHGGVLHRFTIGPAEFDRLKLGERVYLETTKVEGHTHMLFVDPVDPRYRVPGAEPVAVPLDC